MRTESGSTPVGNDNAGLIADANIADFFAPPLPTNGHKATSLQRAPTHAETSTRKLLRKSHHTVQLPGDTPRFVERLAVLKRAAGKISTDNYFVFNKGHAFPLIQEGLLEESDLYQITHKGAPADRLEEAMFSAYGVIPVDKLLERAAAKNKLLFVAQMMREEVMQLCGMQASMISIRARTETDNTQQKLFKRDQRAFTTFTSHQLRVAESALHTLQNAEVPTDSLSNGIIAAREYLAQLPLTVHKTPRSRL